MNIHANLYLWLVAIYKACVRLYTGLNWDSNLLFLYKAVYCPLHLQSTMNFMKTQFKRSGITYWKMYGFDFILIHI